MLLKRLHNFKLVIYHSFV